MMVSLHQKSVFCPGGEAMRPDDLEAVQVSGRCPKLLEVGRKTTTRRGDAIYDQGFLRLRLSAATPHGARRVEFL